MSLEENDIPVMVELDNEHVRLSASGTEIGKWANDECHITLVGDSTYSITAEDETLQFVPNQPGLFAAAVQVDDDPTLEAMPQKSENDAEPNQLHQVGEAPPAKPLTMGLFYALCTVTAALAAWSLISILF